MLYSHGGCCGDIIAQLPLILTKGAGHLNLHPISANGYRMQQDVADNIKPLLEIQPYIFSVEWSLDVKGFDMNVWRDHYINHECLQDMLLTHLGLPHWPRRKPWLVVDKPVREASVVICRTARWHENPFPWGLIRAVYEEDSIFVGTEKEHKEFVDHIGPIRYFKTPNYLDLARVVAGADLVVANQTSVRWIAEGLKKPCVVEVGFMNNTHIDRPGCYYGKTIDFQPPTVKEAVEANNS